MAFRNLKPILAFIAGMGIPLLIAADSEPHMNIKIKSPDEIRTADIVGDRLKVDSTFTGGTSFPVVTRTDVSSTQTVSGQSAWIDTDGHGIISSIISVSAVSGTNPTFQVDIETSEDQTNSSLLISFQRFTTTGVQRLAGTSISARYYRFKWFIDGSSPSFTFTIISTLKAYTTPDVKGLIRYSDVDLTVLNQASTVFNAGTCANISFQAFRADDGGSSSQYMIEVSNDQTNWSSVTGNIALARGTNTVNIFSNYAFRFYRMKVTAAANVGIRVADVFWHCNGGS